MQRKLFISYLCVVLLIFGMMSLSRQTSDKIRGRSASFLTPLAEKILSVKFFLLHPLSPSPWEIPSSEEQKKQLQLENQLLKIERSSLQTLLSEHLSISSRFLHLSQDTLKHTPDEQKAMHRLSSQFKWQLQATPARIIFRSFDLWNHLLWINVGEATNREKGRCLIGKNSPVLLGDTIIGLVEEVGEHHSRVSLITDSRLPISVRAVRGGEQDLLLAQELETIIQQLHQSKEKHLSSEEHTQLMTLLKKWKQQLQPFKKSWYLAKGELIGSSLLSRRGEEPRLQGTGFNYDFADEEGEARDLRTGKPIKNPKGNGLSILKTGDLLVTTGLDGLFPPGFPVAQVTKVETLKEGDYFYNLEARPIAGSFEELSLVFVLPPVKN